MRAIALAAAIVCAPLTAHAKPTKHVRHGPVTQFDGDRYDATAQMAPSARDMTRHLRSKMKRHDRRRVPLPRPRPLREPGSVSPLSFIAGRPAGCPGRAWCGCWLAHHLGISDRSLWLARNWARIGRPVSAQPGAIVVFARGRGGHVGKVTAVADGKIKVLSGNDGRRVRERWRPARGVLAYRML